MAKRPLTPEEDAEFERLARAEVMGMLGKSEIIHAATFAEAVAQAEKLKETHDIVNRRVYLCRHQDLIARGCLVS